jgi:tRNA nucleotidyltransferase (CCA-adding enzyme)
MGNSFEQSYSSKKAESHLDSWQDEIEKSTGSNSRELGIYNHEEIEDRLRQVHQKLIEMKELAFIDEVKSTNKDAGIYLVGGSVRDAVLGREPKDIDLVANKIEPAELVEILVKHGTVVFDRDPHADIRNMTAEEKKTFIKEAYGVIKFKPLNSSLKEHIDVAFTREDDHDNNGQSGILGIKRDMNPKVDPNLHISQDLGRRDYTINSMALNLINGEIFDPFDGIEDLVKREVRSVGDPEERILQEDLSRGPRALSLACVLNGDIEQNTKKAIKKSFQPAEKTIEETYHGAPIDFKKLKKYEDRVRELFQAHGKIPKILQVFWDKEMDKPRMAVHRDILRKELFKGINADGKKMVELLDEVGGLAVLFPEVAAMKGVAQPIEFHREGDVYRHTLKVLENLPKHAHLRVKLAGLFHDLGKVETKGKSEDGRITFHGHAEKSVEKIQKISKRFLFPHEFSQDIQFLVNYHMLPFSDTSKMKDSKIFKVFLEDEELGRDLIRLAKADALASIPENGKPNLDHIEKLKRRIKEIKTRLKKEKDEFVLPLITGKELIDLGIKQGPIFKEILNHIREKQINGEITTPGEAIEEARKFIK